MKVAVVGSGLAGLTAAMSLAKKGIEVTVFGPKPKESNSYLAQAGIAFPISDGDSIISHVTDTIRGGKYLNDVTVVWNVISKSTEAYHFLTSLGIEFTSRELEGGHSFPRIFTIKNETGKYIIPVLEKHAKEMGVNFIRKFAEEVAIHNKKIVGVFVEGELLYFDAVIIASGGFSGLYKFTAGNPWNLGIPIGDLALKGVPLRDIEFIQFHPTGFIGKRTYLISEAVRGAGAKLVTGEGERFVNELETRDVVAREIYRKMLEGKGVFLDATGIEDFKRRFPYIYSFLRREGINPKRDLIPVTPVAHYTIGGISVDIFYRTPIKGLYAIGEAACNGFHGANRLASNSLLECIVSGIEVSRTVIREKPRGERKEAKYHGYEPGNVDEVRDIMWNHAGIIRREESLRLGLKKLEKVEADPRVKILAEAVLKCALAREESRGAHYREDYPYSREEFRRPSIFRVENCML
ncbi:L-aspartate oxidase [Pyrococcus furiosus DSM 3638]|uniref:L-aspartate oxidase n=3 Tax=Pyrococcus furiosus TaxID=2261 RepID=NADB_PYRFU|nr:L-aspartate oxidase [Pyrococcus furiosus]Q8TZL4.1 RecName: Full=L-aspartate oxidase; Short=LASPO; AltName: Full=Quinolinate synthase B [Pyrococcus furiosus DSM 3638]AAL82100.1 l-aspartate oxidase (quinolinate synthetase) [Pyrococcus furiosus DSM 3638]AFN04665.1 L-aspartate oxidase [Pyrococcus furiosus COM1]QEK79571.1 L-aspartate oxidase [Pyrococcus furiosus DSM 3638]